MSNLPQSPNSYSQQINGNKHANIIATISIAIALLFWGLIYGKLDQLDTRMRTVEQATVALLAIHNAQNVPVLPQPGRATSPGSAISP